MLISCFQCRQPMDVAEDSAGRRVRCPHCQYVIVVPAKVNPIVPEESVTPTLALPNLDLDSEERPVEVKRPIEPIPPPIPEKKIPVEDVPPELPPITRPKRRRAPEISQGRSGTPWGKIIGIGSVGAFVVVVLISVIAGDVFHQRKQPAPIVFNPPAVAVPQPAPFPPPKMFEMPRIDMPKMQAPIMQFPGVFGFLNWQNISLPDQRCHVSLPGPINDGRADPVLKLTFFEVRQDDWEFAVAHGSMPEPEFTRVALVERFRLVNQTLRDRLNPFVVMNETVIHLNGVHPGREWHLNSNGKTQYVRSYFVRDQDQVHHYLLTAQGPFNTNRNHPNIERFFNSFGVNVAEGGNSNVGLVVREEKDDVNAGGMRDNEYTALALHPKRPLAILGSARSAVSIVPLGGPAKDLRHDFVLDGSKPIEQIAVSQDGRWLALAVNGAIEYRCDWDNAEVSKCFNAPGLWCAFTKDHQLLIASARDIRQYDPDTVLPGAPLAVDFTIRGFTLSPDETQLAVWGDKVIALWNWPDKKPLGRIDAHAAPITRVAFAPDGKSFASASVDRSIKLWHADTREERATLREHAWTVWDLAFHPNGKHLVSAGLDGMMLVWDLEPEPRLVWAQAQQFPVRNVAFTANGKHCLLTCKRPNRDERFAGRQYTRQLRKIAWSDVKPAQDDNAVKKIVAERAGLHLPTIGTIFFTPDGRSILTGGDSLEGNANLHPLRIWDAASARVRHTHLAQYGGALSPDGKWFVFAAAGKLQMLDVEKNRVLPDSLPFNLNYVPAPVVFGPDGKSFWITLQNKYVRVEFQPRLARTKDVIELRPLNELPNVRLVTILPAADHKSFLIDSTPPNERRERILYSAHDGTELPAPKLDATEWSAFTRVRRYVDRSIVLEDVLQGKTLAIGQQRSGMQFSTMSPDRTHGVTEANYGGALRTVLWDPAARRPVLTLPESNARTTSQLRFSTDGRNLAWTTNGGWTRVVPLDWLLERKDLLPCNAREVSPP